MLPTTQASATAYAISVPEIGSETRLTDLPVADRIEYARRIPDLIDAAREQEEEVSKDADEVVAMLEQRLAMEE